MYYGLVCISVLLFAAQFLTKIEYVKKMGSGMFQTMFLTLFGGVLTAVIMLVANKFRFEYTHFTLIMSFVVFANTLIFTICSFKAFEYVNLAVYSIYSMLGGMILPILAGVCFYNEPFAWGLGICVVFVCAAIVLVSVHKDKDKEEQSKPEKKNKIAILFYIGVFVFNGLSGVISKFYMEAPYAKASSAGFSLLTALVMVVLSFVYVAIRWKQRPAIYVKPTLIALCGNAGNRVANFLLLIALVKLPASVNYSFVTGGTIIVSTILTCFTEKKPSKNEWIAVVAAFVGIMFLVFMPV